MSELSRRHVLAAGALGVAGVAVAGCSSGDGTPSAESNPPSESPTDAAPAQSGQAIVAAADVPVAGGVIVDAGETKVVVTQPQADEVVGFSAVCPHQGCLVNQITDEVIVCPCHGSGFAIADGAVVRGPSPRGLSAVPVRLDGDQIVLA